MSRRHIAYAVLVVASFVVSACSQPMAPVADDTTTCTNKIYVAGGGYVCGDQ